MTRVYMVRHGRAAAGWNVDPDPGLDELGRSQSLAVATKLSPLGPLPVMSSPLLRCQQTAFPLSTAWKQEVVVEQVRLLHDDPPTDRIAKLHFAQHRRIVVLAPGIAQVREAGNDRVNRVDLVLRLGPARPHSAVLLRALPEQVRIAQVLDVSGDGIGSDVEVVGHLRHVGETGDRLPEPLEEGHFLRRTESGGNERVIRHNVENVLDESARNLPTLMGCRHRQRVPAV